jgi:uncharacterized protein (DUF433 family)
MGCVACIRKRQWPPHIEVQAMNSREPGGVAAARVRRGGRNADTPAGTLAYPVTPSLLLPYPDTPARSLSTTQRRGSSHCPLALPAGVPSHHEAGNRYCDRRQGRAPGWASSRRCDRHRARAGRPGVQGQVRSVRTLDGTHQPLRQARGRRFAPEAHMSSRFVIVDPETHSGTPVFAGTRVPIRTLSDHLEAGDSLEVFLDHFPCVPRGPGAPVVGRPKAPCLAEAAQFARWASQHRGV